MGKVLFVTSNKEFFNDVNKEFNLKISSDVLSEGKWNKKDVALALVDNTKIDSTLVLTYLLSTSLSDKIKKIIVVNPVQCPDNNVSLGQVVVADSISEWDKSLSETKVFTFNVPKFETKIIKGKGLSGDRCCVNKTTPIMQSRLIDVITFSLSKVAGYFNIPLLSTGIVVDYCSPNFSRQLQSNIREFSSRMIDFLKSNSSILLGE